VKQPPGPTDWVMKYAAAESDRPYQAGRSKNWIKVKNREHPAMERVMERSTSL